MAKFDTSTIEGYADMTAEQKLAALEAVDIPEPDYSGYVKKDLYDKAAHDAADWKKKHNALLSEEDRAKAAREEQDAAIQKELEELRKDRTISKHTASFIGQGYSKESAQTMAEALANGDTDAFFTANQAALAEMAKKKKADDMKHTSRPPAGDNPGADGVEAIKDKLKKAEEAGDALQIAHLTRKLAEASAANET